MITDVYKKLLDSVKSEDNERNHVCHPDADTIRYYLTILDDLNKEDPDSALIPSFINFAEHIGITFHKSLEDMHATFVKQHRQMKYK